MKHIINKCIIFAITIGLTYPYTNMASTGYIISLLFSLTAACIFPALCSTYRISWSGDAAISDKERLARRISEGFLCLYFLSYFLLYPVFIFAGIAVYDIYRFRQKFSPIILTCAMIYMAFCLPMSLITIVLCIIAASVLLSIYSCNVDSLKEELLTIRDTTAEHDMIVEANTRQLLENQDAMITNATLSERNRIAREIHDNVGHLLTRSILQTGAIKVINKDEKLIKPLTQLQSTLDTAMDSMRRSVHDLHDEAVDLQSAISDIANGIRDFDVHIDYDMGSHIPKDIKYSFINIVKEAVNNAVKHSNGNQINIKLHEHPAFYQLLVTDNGTDIHLPSGTVDTDNIEPGKLGIGLNNISQRVNMLNGTLKISVNKGFSILVTVMKKGDK